MKEQELNFLIIKMKAWNYIVNHYGMENNPLYKNTLMIQLEDQ